MISDSNGKSLRSREKKGVNPRSLDNLRLFEKGQSGNPQGRRNAGMSVKEWLNQMQDWTREKVQSVIDDNAAPVNKVAAARLWFSACSDSSDFDRLMDRTNGKPGQSLDLTSDGESLVKVLRGVSMDEI